MRGWTGWLVPVAAAVLAAGAEAQTFRTEGPTLYEGARLIVGDGTVVEDAAFLVDGGRFTRVGRRGEVLAPEGGARVDLGGKTVIPAMIDAHLHLGLEGYTSWGWENYTRENVIDHLHRNAYHGIGAVFSTGIDRHDVVAALQRDQAAGRVGGARLLWSAGMAPPGQGPNQRLLDAAEAAGVELVRGVADEADARRAVAEVAAEGIPFVKIWVDDRNGAQEKLRPELYRAIIEEATRRGIRIHAHQQTRDDMEGLLRAGVAGFLHGRLSPDVYDDEILALLRERGAFVVPNLGLGELRRRADQHADPFLREAVPPGVVERLRATACPDPPTAEEDRAQRETLRRMIDAGVEIVLGTDAGAVPDHFFGYAAHRELEIYVRLGMTPMQALVAATSRPAAHLGLADLGTVAPGKSADFVVLAANPLDDIRNTRRIARVFLRGAEVDRAGLRARWVGGS